MRTVRTKVYKFSELGKQAKEKAIEKHRNINTEYFDWYDATYDDAKEIGKLMGIDIDKIHFSGFSSQGDGACFEGYLEPKTDILKNVKDYAPKDEKLHQIADELETLQKKYNASASIKHSGHYYHEYCTVFDFDDNDTLSQDDFSTMEDEIIAVVRRFMNWIYRQLESECEYLESDEAVIETIEANNYEFTKDGEVFNR